MNIGLIGIPNCGKSTLFCALTSRQAQIGNWPGATVEKQEGYLKGNNDICLVDLPGVVLLSECGCEERVAVEYLYSTACDMALLILDATDLRTSLALAHQVKSTGIPVVAALNLIDEADRLQIRVDVNRLEQLLECRVIPVSGKKGTGIDQLIQNIQQRLVRHGTRPMPTAEESYKWADSIIKQVISCGADVRRQDDVLDGQFFSYGKWLLGIGMIGFIYLIVQLGPVTQLFITPIYSQLTGAVGYMLKALGAGDFWVLLLQEGVVDSVFSVIQFLPQLFLLYLAMEWLQNSGLMARIAVLLDRPLSFLGLGGASAIPLLLGVGCTVSACEGCKTLRVGVLQQKTAFAAGYIPCGAKLATGLMLAQLICPKQAFAVFLAGILISIITMGVVCAVGPGVKHEYVLILPPYRKPAIKTILWGAFCCTGDFVKKVGSIIAAAGLLFWMLLHLGLNMAPCCPQDSILVFVCAKLAPLFWLQGLADWRYVAALAGGLLAKECVISGISLFGGVSFGVAQGLSFFAFFMLYPPCISAFGAEYQLLGLAKTVRHFLLRLLIAWCVSAMVFAITTCFLKI